MTNSSVNSIQQLLLAAADRLPPDASSTAPLLRQVKYVPSAARSEHVPYVTNNGSVARLDRQRLPSQDSSDQLGPRIDKSRSARNGVKASADTAGPMWFDLPKTLETPQVTRDLKLLANRNVLDPHRHYKKEDRKNAIPKFSQVGTIIEGPTEFFSGRLSHKERKQTLAEDLLAGEKDTGRFNAKFQQLQQAKSSGRDRHKRLKSRRKK